VKPVVIIAISVVCSVVAVIGVLALSDKYILSEDEQFLEDVFKKLEEQNKADVEAFKEACHNKFDGGKALEDCLNEVERMRQDLEEVIAAGRQDAKILSP